MNHDRDVMANTFVMQHGDVIRRVKTLGERLKAVRKLRRLSQSKLAQSLGMRQSAISNIESGSRTHPRDLLGIANALNVDPDWLNDGSGPSPFTNPAGSAQGATGGDIALQKTGSTAPPISLEQNPDFPAIRWAHIKASAGITGFAIDYDKQNADQAPIVFSKSWFDRNGYRPDRLIAMTVHGQSMEPSLFDGDTIVINLDSDKPKDGVAYVVLYEGETTVKRLMRDVGQWWLVSDNADQRRYPRKVCDENTKIIGEVVYKQSDRI